MTIWLVFPLSFLLGSIPTALWVGRIFGGIDIREHGSRNAGLTNVFRVLGWKPALPVAMVDFGKGLAAVLLGRWATGGHETLALACGLLAVLGHTFTIFGGFRGGKGVLTGLGVFAAVSPVTALLAFGVWVVVMAWKGYVSLASITASLVLALANTFMALLHLRADLALGWCHAFGLAVSRGDTSLAILSWLTAMFVILKHRPNIQRLREGTEHGFRRSRDQAAARHTGRVLQRRSTDAARHKLALDEVVILGAGSWGMAMGLLLDRKGLRVRLWEHDPNAAECLARSREQPSRLPGVRLPESIGIHHDLALALGDAATVLVAVPSHTVRATCRAVSVLDPGARLGGRAFVSLAKGIEEGTLCRMTEVLRQELPHACHRQIAVLSGPSHAEEVAALIPTTVTVACHDPWLAAALQDLFFWAPAFRTYRSTDVVGVELCGAVKNVIAIASGILDGLGLGDNTRGALLTRGMAEMARLGARMGGRRESFYGLAGMGDLVTTCTSRHSRNRHVGEQVGLGRPLAEVLAGMSMVAEGVRSVRAVRALAIRHGVDMPLTEEVHAVLFEGREPREALGSLMARAARAEAD